MFLHKLLDKLGEKKNKQNTIRITPYFVLRQIIKQRGKK